MSARLIHALFKLRPTSTSLSPLAVTSDAFSSLLTSTSTSRTLQSSSDQPHRGGSTLALQHGGKDNLSITSSISNPSPSTIHARELVDKTIDGKILQGLVGKWYKDNRDPTLRLSPQMESFKRKFMQWILEGNEGEAVKHFQLLMREAWSIGQGTMIPKVYWPDWQMLAELYRTLIKVHEKSLEDLGMNTSMGRGSDTSTSPTITEESLYRSHQRDMEEALSWSKATRHQPFPHVYGSLLDAYIALGDPEGASGVVSKMKACGHPVHDYTNSKVAVAYAKSGQAHKAWAMLKPLIEAMKVGADGTSSGSSRVQDKGVDQSRVLLSTDSALYAIISILRTLAPAYSRLGEVVRREAATSVTSSDASVLSEIYPIYRHYSKESAKGCDIRQMQSCLEAATRLKAFDLVGSILDDVASDCNLLPFPHHVTESLSLLEGMVGKWKNLKAPSSGGVKAPFSLPPAIRFSLLNAAKASLSGGSEESREICKKTFVLASYDIGLKRRLVSMTDPSARSPQSSPPPPLSGFYQALLTSHASSKDFESVFRTLGSYEDWSQQEGFLVMGGQARDHDLNPRLGLAFLVRAIGVDEGTVAAAYDQALIGGTFHLALDARTDGHVLYPHMISLWSQLAARHSRSEAVTTLMLNIILRSLAILPPPHDSVNPVEAEKVAAAAAVEATGRFFEEFSSAGVHHDVESYNAVMEACARASNLPAVSSLMNHMTSRGEGEGGDGGEKGDPEGKGQGMEKVRPPRPNHGTWVIFVKAHVDSGDYRGALDAIGRGSRIMGGRGLRIHPEVLGRGAELAGRAGDEGAVVGFRRLAREARERGSSRRGDYYSRSWSS